jgi:hypothetical protein
MLVHSLGPIHIDESQLFGALDQVQREVGRLDGEAICEFHRRIDGEAIAARQAKGGLPAAVLSAWRDDCAQRQDALPAGVSAFPRDLEFIRARELEQIRRPLNGDIFPVDRSVPIGAREHTYRRRVGRGEAILTRGDTENYGHARTGRIEEKFPVAYIVCSVKQTYFEMLSTDYAGVQQYASDLRMAYRLVDERRNRILWNGDAATQLYGVLNFPELMKMVLSITIGTSTPVAVVAALHEFVDKPATLSGEAMQPDTLVVSPRIWRYISQTKLDTGSDTTILQFFLAGQDSTNGIRRVIKAQELAGIGPGGSDAMLAFRSEIDAVSNIEVMPTMTMPVYQASALSWLTLVVAATGGIVMPNVGENIVGYVNFA